MVTIKSGMFLVLPKMFMSGLRGPADFGLMARKVHFAAFSAVHYYFTHAQTQRFLTHGLDDCTLT